MGKIAELQARLDAQVLMVYKHVFIYHRIEHIVAYYVLLQLKRVDELKSSGVSKAVKARVYKKIGQLKVSLFTYSRN